MHDPCYHFSSSNSKARRWVSNMFLRVPCAFVLIASHRGFPDFLPLLKFPSILPSIIFAIEDTTQRWQMLNHQKKKKKNLQNITQKRCTWDRYFDHWNGKRISQSTICENKKNKKNVVGKARVCESHAGVTHAFMFYSSVKRLVI